MKKQYTNCPHCDNALIIQAADVQQRGTKIRPTWQQTPKTLQGGWAHEPTFVNETSLAIPATPVSEAPPQGRYTKRTPTRAPSKEADVIVPLLRAVIGGTTLQALIWLIIYGGLGYFNFVGFFITWIALLYISWEAATRGFDKLLVIYEEIEDALSKDEPEPTKQAEPDEARYTVVIEDESNSSEPVKVRDYGLPAGITNEIFQNFCYGIYHQKKSFSRDQWARGESKIMKDKQWKDLIEHCKSLGYTTGEGVEQRLTKKGEALFRSIADDRTVIN